MKQGSRDGRLSAGDDRRKWGSWCSGGARTRGTKYGLVTRHDKKTPRSSFRRSARGLTTIRPPVSRVGRCEDDARTIQCRAGGTLKAALECVRTSGQYHARWRDAQGGAWIACVQASHLRVLSTGMRKMSGRRSATSSRIPSRTLSPARGSVGS